MDRFVAQALLAMTVVGVGGRRIGRTGVARYGLGPSTGRLDVRRGCAVWGVAEVWRGGGKADPGWLLCGDALDGPAGEIQQCRHDDQQQQDNRKQAQQGLLHP